MIQRKTIIILLILQLHLIGFSNNLRDRVYFDANTNVILKFGVGNKAGVNSVFGLVYQIGKNDPLKLINNFPVEDTTALFTKDTILFEGRIFIKAIKVDNQISTYISIIEKGKVVKSGECLIDNIVMSKIYHACGSLMIKKGRQIRKFKIDNLFEDDNDLDAKKKRQYEVHAWKIPDGKIYIELILSKSFVSKACKYKNVSYMEKSFIW